MDRYHVWLKQDVLKREISFRLKQAFSKVRQLHRLFISSLMIGYS